MDSIHEIDRPAGLAHAHLRAATAAEHVLLERELVVNSPHARDADRLAFLCAIYQWFGATSRGLWNDGPPGAWSPDVRAGARDGKHDVLAADLRAHGVDPGRLPVCRARPRLDDPWVRLGYAYVHEGSLLGGRVVRERWRRAGSRLAEVRYFDGYGAESGAMWRAFLDELERRTVDAPDGLRRAGLAAEDAFRSLRRWCRGCGVSR